MTTKKNLTRAGIFAILFLVSAVLFTEKELSRKVESGATTLFESKELSKEEYAKMKEEFLGLVSARDPRVALGALRARIQGDVALLRSCHAMVHEIGQKAYEKYADFGEAAKYQDEICNSGYLHGIIESHFSQSVNVFTAMQTVCDPYPLGKHISWECYHGVGHGVMYYTSNDLPRSLELCEKYENSFARSTCANGVFMENFNTDQKLHPSKFINPRMLFYGCEKQTLRYKADCYSYAPVYRLSLYRNDYRGALVWCVDAERSYRSVCTRGVGSQAMKENIGAPKIVEKICMSNGSGQEAPCVNGMVGLLVNHYGSLEPVRKVCMELEPSNRQICNLLLQESAAFFD